MIDDNDYVDELPTPPRKDILEADRQLLELVARALGARFEEVDGEGYGNLHFDDGTIVYAWNSLVHSDDAFDLIVRLGLSVAVKTDEEYAIASPARKLERGELGSFEDLTGEPFAATRRAVTRAAAEIGKSMG